MENNWQHEIAFERIINKVVNYDVMTHLKGDDIWIIDDVFDEAFCKHLIDRFDKDDRISKGEFYGSTSTREWKKGTDLCISYFKDWEDEDKKVFKGVSSAIGKFIEQLDIETGLDEKLYHLMFEKDEGYQIQKTEVGEYFKWHIDTLGTPEMSMRQVAVLIYLNDEGIEGGETGFPRQSVKVCPKRGRVVIAPSGWTHLHAGLPVTKGTKYIIFTTFKRN